MNSMLNDALRATVLIDQNLEDDSGSNIQRSFLARDSEEMETI